MELQMCRGIKNYYSLSLKCGNQQLLNNSYTLMGMQELTKMLYHTIS